MKQIIVVPLDERPCNYDFPLLIGGETDYRIHTPPRDLLGNKKEPGDILGIWTWLFDNIKKCDAAILSIDMLVYSGIVPSRLHNDDVDTLLFRLENIKRLKELNPGVVLFAYSLIMRNPKYSSSDEEPDYYEDYGSRIHRYGVIKHLTELGIASEADKNELEDINSTLPDEYLRDYLDRRGKNIRVNKNVIELASEGYLDFVIIPQDDASPYGLTAKDQQIIRRHISQYQMNLKVYMYPDADAVANTLLARYINYDAGRTPLVYIKYASSAGDGIIPLFEDRIISESIKYQILAAGGLVASSVSEADIVLMINVPSGNMKDFLANNQKGSLPAIEYDASRNLLELVEYASYAINSLNKAVVFGDVAYANGGDVLLFNLLKQKGILFNLAGYAGWNTSSNSLGTCIPMGMVFNIYGHRKAHSKFLAHRYIEDIGFCSIVRQEVVEEIMRMGYSLLQADGKGGVVANMVKERLQAFADDNLIMPEAKVIIKNVYLPWNRMFEVGLEVDINA